MITDQSERLNVGAPVKEKDGADLGREGRKIIVKQNNNKKINKNINKKSNGNL